MPRVAKATPKRSQEDKVFNFDKLNEFQNDLSVKPPDVIWCIFSHLTTEELDIRCEEMG